MAHITGVGGVFFRTDEQDNLFKWYRDILKLPVIADHPGFWFTDRQPDAGTVIGLFKADSDYFGRPDQAFMINFRVDNLEEFLADVAERGVTPDKPVESHPEGKFAWLCDPAGNRIELWEPATKP